ncbi:putative RNA polymerase sigma factor FecI [Pseudomonas reidholzensis]|uniref:Putative RNA polymerase sigma factor FecI n=1 Tax=Pseudomonas reidholzensis TaxID=1785162 RepID=A0A383RQI5_9PSED|nr:sigma-70 family RNA polymerase sigma factor [Pseudomonas reidholzensis]SYX88701.1 putative RNA polymerase sigma factor FecI [Pseudomonas reidholzensis]
MDAGSTGAPAVDIEQLYGEHHGWLRGWLRVRTGNHADAADLAQDTFVRMLGLRQLPVLREPRHYLVTIARGLLIDKSRRRLLEQAYLETLAARPEPVQISAEAQHLIIESLLAIDSMLDGLGARTRQIFLLVQLEGLSYVEVGRQLGLSVTTVKNHLAKAMLNCILLVDE